MDGRIMRELLAHLVGDYIVQSHWQASTKTKQNRPAAYHTAGYTLCFLPLTRDPRALGVIGATHYVIDRYRLARYLVWAKNQVAPRDNRYRLHAASPSGYPEDVPPWLGVWLMIAADNTMHMLINHLALRIGKER